MKPPLTSAKLGSTRCVGCERLFTATADMLVVELPAEVPNTGRIDSIGQRHRGIGTHTVMRRWHTACYEEFVASNDAYRARVEADQEELVRSMCEAAGLDYETVKAEHDRRQAEARA